MKKPFKKVIILMAVVVLFFAFITYLNYVRFDGFKNTNHPIRLLAEEQICGNIITKKYYCKKIYVKIWYINLQAANSVEYRKVIKMLSDQQYSYAYSNKNESAYSNINDSDCLASCQYCYDITTKKDNKDNRSWGEPFHPSLCCCYSFN